MKPIPPSPYFRKIIDALLLVSPYCLAGRFENGLAHCVEASVSGAAALDRLKIKARAIPCAILGKRADARFTVGLSARDVYALTETSEPFEEWARGGVFPPEDKLVIHMVIEARFAGHRALIDLTYGQLRAAHGIDVPLTCVAFGGGWPRFDGDGWEIMYIDSPQGQEINALAGQYLSSGMTGMRDDYHDMIQAALRCGNDPMLFERMVRAQVPDQYEVTRTRLQRFMTLGGPEA